MLTHGNHECIKKRLNYFQDTYQEFDSTILYSTFFQPTTISKHLYYSFSQLPIDGMLPLYGTSSIRWKLKRPTDGSTKLSSASTSKWGLQKCAVQGIHVDRIVTLQLERKQNLFVAFKKWFGHQQHLSSLVPVDGRRPCFHFNNNQMNKTNQENEFQS